MQDMECGVQHEEQNLFYLCLQVYPRLTATRLTFRVENSFTESGALYVVSTSALAPSATRGHEEEPDPEVFLHDDATSDVTRERAHYRIHFDQR